MEFTDWLVQRGARYLVINSNKGLVSGCQALRLRFWKSYGAKILILTNNMSEEEGVQNLLEAAASLSPVSAIFNLIEVSIIYILYRYINM